MQNINEDNLFLSLIESKDFSTPQMQKYLSEKLSDENMKKILKSSKEEMNDYEKEEIELEIMMKGEEELIKETRREIFELLEFMKENRTSPISPEIAVLTEINGHIYNFNTLTYLDKNYYINCAIPFSKILEDKDWKIIYDQKEKPQIIFYVDKKTLFELFYDEYHRVIDNNAENKIIKLK